MPSSRPRLDEILAVTRARVAALLPYSAALERRAAAVGPPRGGRGGGGAFPRSQTTVGVIAEVKRRSPSQGAINLQLDPVAHARAYEQGGAVAISVLTDEAHFGGSLDDLTRVAEAVAVPTLRKDFILDEVQLVEARGAGASVVLLIARILAPRQVAMLARAARGMDLSVLVEVHAERELGAVLDAGVEADAIGVNARDLDTFSVDVASAERLLSRVPGTWPAVAESGIERREDVERLAAAGADFVLVGTSVARAADPEGAVRALTGVRRVGRG